MDTQNDGFGQGWLLLNMGIIGIYVQFLGCMSHIGPCMVYYWFTSQKINHTWQYISSMPKKSYVKFPLLFLFPGHFPRHLHPSIVVPPWVGMHPPLQPLGFHGVRPSNRAHRRWAQGSRFHATSSPSVKKKQKTSNTYHEIMVAWQFFVTFLGWLSDLLRG